MTQAMIHNIPNESDFFFPAQRGDTVFGGWSPVRLIWRRRRALCGSFIIAFIEPCDSERSHPDEGFHVGNSAPASNGP